MEVADSSLPTDRGEKLAAYARGGVPRYWIVNLVDGVIETYSSPVAAGGYQASRVYHRGVARETFCSTCSPRVGGNNTGYAATSGPD